MKKFNKAIKQLSMLFQELVNSSQWRRDNLPEKGIYVFYENKRPIYVGRSNRMKARIQEHGRSSSTHNSAPFAFNLAKEEAERRGIEVNIPREKLQQNPVFRKLFSKTKKRVSRMSIKAIRVNDPIIQALFEIYVAIEMDTKYNDFDTH